jgi:hypothetical protein
VAGVKKLLLGGIWVCAVTSASVYFASWNAGTASAPAEEAYLQGLDYVKTRQITVPRIAEGKIQGYVIARFVFTVDAQALRQLAVPPEVFVVDEAFRAIYGEDKLDFADLRKVDLSGLAAMIATKVNDRVQPELVKEVLVEQFDYVPYSTIGSPTVPPGISAPSATETQDAHEAAEH